MVKTTINIGEIYYDGYMLRESRKIIVTIHFKTKNEFHYYTTVGAQFVSHPEFNKIMKDEAWGIMWNSLKNKND